MDIINIPFESSLFFKLDGEIVELIPFKTQEQTNVKFGVKAPRSIKVHREEIYEAIKNKSERSQR